MSELSLCLFVSTPQRVVGFWRMWIVVYISKMGTDLAKDFSAVICCFSFHVRLWRLVWHRQALCKTVDQKPFLLLALMLKFILNRLGMSCAICTYYVHTLIGVYAWNSSWDQSWLNRELQRILVFLCSNLSWKLIMNVHHLNVVLLSFIFWICCSILVATFVRWLMRLVRSLFFTGLRLSHKQIGRNVSI